MKVDKSPIIWLSADHHFGHDNSHGGIIKMCNRPFSNIKDMDEALIHNINKYVKETDFLYHLGDFAFRNTNPIQYYLDRIKCKNIFLIVGNHDPRTKNKKPQQCLYKLFSDVREIMQIRVNVRDHKQSIILCHYAMRIWDKSHFGAFHAFGHSHYALPDNPKSLSIDVGVDAVAGRATGRTHKQLADNDDWKLLNPEDYRPISFYEFADLMKNKDFESLDHHKDKRERIKL